MGNLKVETRVSTNENLEQKQSKTDSVRTESKDDLSQAIRGNGNVEVQSIGGYEENSENNSFLMNYLVAKAGEKFPEGMTVKVSSPKEYSDEFRELLRSVRVDIYGARVADMFRLLVQDEKAVKERVAQMKISDEEKNKIMQLKKLFDNFYGVKVQYEGKTYDILHPTDKEKEELKEKAPEFAKFIEKEQADLKKQTSKFAQMELEHLELSAAGQESKDIVPYLLGFLAFLGTKDVYKAVRDRKAAMKDAAGFLKEQRVLRHGKGGFVNPFTDLVERYNTGKMKYKSKWLAPLALLPVIMTTLGGSVDDISGAVKDYYQDKECFGKEKALNLNSFAAFMGFATSFAISSTYENVLDKKRATKYVHNNFLKEAKENGTIDRVKRLRKAFAPKGLQRLRAGGKGAIAAGLFGMLIASATSGSSWTSMAGTRLFFGQNGDELAKKNIIDEKDNTFENSNENMMKYEAYSGKWHGIAVGPTSDPVVGFTFGATGALTSPYAAIASSAFATQGCSETLTAGVCQLAGGAVRENKLDNAKNDLVQSAKNEQGKKSKEKANV